MPKDNKVKYGLWEDGKRIEWFNETQVQAINNGQMNYTTFFHQTDSERMVEPNAHFYKPISFEERLAEVQRRIEELTLRARQNNAGSMGMTAGAHDQMTAVGVSPDMMPQGYGGGQVMI